ncbi:hypothetical protein, partial [Albidovulum sp.]|uniref:hypothetical protein n=1 Tax=Albidovulum sp. TaxID=1872424 RepID=UPI003389FC15|nr:hypothetical protein [Paracoccaceae bacterium]
MSARDFYLNYWAAFSHQGGFPNLNTPDIPTKKNANEGYRRFQKRWPLGFMLVARASIRDDEISAQFFTGSAGRGHEFLDWLSPSSLGLIQLRSGACATVHKGETDGKVELFWHHANLADEAFWPSHFHWLRIALHELAESLGPKLDTFCEAHA